MKRNSKLYKIHCAGLKNTDLKLFDHGRHEMLNEINTGSISIHLQLD